MDKLINFLKKILDIQSPSKNKTYIYYEEKDTPCDKCIRKDECAPYLINVTHSNDKRTHFIKNIEYICPINEKIDKALRQSKAVIQLPHPSTYILDVLHEGFKHVDPDDSIRIGFTKDELEYLIECVKEKEEKNGDFNSNS